MVGIPAGTFTKTGGYNGEDPKQITVAAFCMDRTEVKASAYDACAKSGKCTHIEFNGQDAVGGLCNSHIVAAHRRGPNHPANCVKSFQADAYCKAQGLRLPDNDEWEYAARGTDGRLYPWGNADPSDQLCSNGVAAHFPGSTVNGTCPVASFPKGNSPFGLADMAGNVEEWTTSAAYEGADYFEFFLRGGSGVDEIPFPFRNHRYNRSSSWNGTTGFRCAGSPLP